MPRIWRAPRSSIVGSEIKPVTIPALLAGFSSLTAEPAQPAVSSEAWLAIISGLLGLLTAGFLALLNAWISARAGVDEVLRSQRLTFYPRLWTITEAVSRWPRVTVTRGSLDELHHDLRSWYYASGGLFLSESARARYGNAQELIEALLTHAGDPADALVSDEHTALMDTASALRTALTQDLDTRRRKSVVEKGRRAIWHHQQERKAQKRIAGARMAVPIFVRPDGAAT
jgi:hypothetical protein